MDSAAAVLATSTVTEVEDGSQVVQQHQLSEDQLQADTEQAADEVEAQEVEPQLQDEASTAVAEAQQAQQAESPVALPKVGTASNWFVLGELCHAACRYLRSAPFWGPCHERFY